MDQRNAINDSDVHVTILRVSDGAVRVFVQPASSQADNDYLWREGNHACDCSLAECFAKAGGEDDPGMPCGSGAFDLVDLKVVPRD
jgi:hypothetical protein